MVDIGGIINRLAPLIEKKVRTEYNLLINAKTEARKLSFNLIEVQKVLEEAERRRLTDPRIKIWLERLQDVTYEIDDALDEWETIDHQLETEEEDDDDGASHTWWEKVSIFVESLCSFSKHVFRRRDMALKIRELNEKVDLIGKETAKYTLLPISADSQDVIKSEITTSYGELFELEGQEREKKEVITLLNRGTQDPRDHIQVISLVGMAGIGKTTIAQLAFRDPGVRSSFKLKSWVCVAHISDMASVAKIILRSLGVSYPEYAELQKLLELIESSISGKKFLLVLDHLRIEDDGVLNQLKASLCFGAPGSRIIVTSRHKNIAKLMGSTEIRMVEELSKEDCWLLFSGIAFDGRAKREREMLEGIGQGIARKCYGLPLAAKTLGYYLQSRYSKELWEDVLEKEVWQLDEVAKSVFAPLALSYNELLLAVKHCFSYSGILPKDFDIDVDELIRLWMVQGYLSSSAAGTDMEVKGRDYFEKLAVRSFFQRIRYTLEGNVKLCRMHGILHDFAQYLMQTGSKVQKHRSFYSVDELSPYKLDSLRSVRVLILRCREMEELPSGIGDLIHLRYLDLSHISIQRLPVTICELYNLQSLDLRHCKQLSELPKSIHRLRSLRHLLIQGSGLKQLPRGIQTLTGLRTLDDFTVGKEASKLSYLAKLNQLRGSIRIYIKTLDEVEDVCDDGKSYLESKIYISDLCLIISGEVRMDVMEALKVPPNLLRLRIFRYGGTQFPSWISTSLEMLRELDFMKCNQCLDLPPLGALPFLETLGFKQMKSLKCVGRYFLGISSSVTSSGSVAFPKLRLLWFLECDSWDEWEDITGNEDQSTLSIMPCLQEIKLGNCNNLKGLPHLLLGKATSVQLLKISSCSLLSRRYKASPDRNFLSPHIQAAMSFH